ncbi:hypothetical protein NIES2101_14135 [Calothrix sp. HK-06]|nr:hypothetical protein NIES2101_14135 [Calothrix sp. HK-06]
MKTSTKLVLATALLGTLGLGVLAKSVYANQSNPDAAIVTSPKFQIAEAWDDDDVKERQEAEKVQKLAKITPQQAQKAAEDHLKGKAKEVELENDNGNLVYEVTIGHIEVAVDAGNAKILYTEKIGEEYDDATEAARPRSSIQVPRTAN